MNDIITHIDPNWTDFRRVFAEMGYRNIDRTDCFAQIGQFYAMISPLTCRIELVSRNTGEALIFLNNDPEALFLEMADYLETEGVDETYSRWGHLLHRVPLLPSVIEDDIPKCKICGEDTTHNRESSFFGSVHRWGPRDHDFTV